MSEPRWVVEIFDKASGEWSSWHSFEKEDAEQFCDALKRANPNDEFRVAKYRRVEE